MSDRRTIIFITIYPFNDDYAKKYGFEILKRRGFDIVILNIFKLLYPHAVDKLSHYNHLNFVCGIRQQSFASWEELQKKIINIPGWKIVFLVVYPYIRLLKALKNAGVEYMRSLTAEGPPCQLSATLYGRVGDSLKRFVKGPISMLSGIIDSKVPYWLLGVDHPRYLILGPGGYSARAVDSSTTVIRAHSCDYDRYLSDRNRPKPGFIPDGPYYVHLVNHPWDIHDNILSETKTAITRDEYKAIINRFHDHVERVTGKPVLVAAYPKATADENIYEGRPFLYDTEQLVKYSCGVLSHFTGALNFAVIHRKPICFLSIRQLDADELFKNCTAAYAAELGLTVHYIDTDDDCRRVAESGMFEMDERHFAQFSRKYIVDDGPEHRLYWDIVCDELLAPAGGENK